MLEKHLDIYLLHNFKLSLNIDRLKELRKEVELFLEQEKHMNNIDFAKDVMFSHELKANNAIEGYTDDLQVIKNVIENAKNISNTTQRQRILNLCCGYQYILQEQNIDKEKLKKLYKILSENLLDEEALSQMGEYYREGEVFILKTSRIDFDLQHDYEEQYRYEAVPYPMIETFMNFWFELAHDTNGLSRPTDYFIRSQILHFYFVYIHPYFDINGRTSRTVAMQYLLKHQAYPFIIFNRAINFDRSNYEKALSDVRDYKDLTFFLKYMLINVKKELEKEYIMNSISQSTTGRLKSGDYQTIEYFLSMNGLKTVLDFVAFYKRQNNFKKVKEIFEEMIDPLIQKDILIVNRNTTSYMYNDKHNLVLSLNTQKIDNDPQKITRLKI